MSENVHLLRARNDIVLGLKMAAAMIAGALLLSFARRQGWVNAEQVMRGNNVIIGLALAVFCNAMPKRMNRSPRTVAQATLAQSIARVGGWAMTLAFVAWAALWAFSPQPFASIGGMVAVGAGVVLMMGYAAWKCIAFHTSKSH